MNNVLSKLGKIGLVPVIKLDSHEEAIPLGKALLEGGLPVAEITFRTAAAEDSIKILAQRLPELLLGAGTILSTTQVDAAVAAGARYIVTPGFNPKVVAYCVEKRIPVIPGVNSASHVEQAMEMGLDVVKFFPAGPSGGVDMLKAFAGPYGDKISFIPTGGVGPNNLTDYLLCPNVFAVGGSWMVPSDAITAGDFAKIGALCREARLLSLGFSLLHIGINPCEEKESIAEAREFAEMLGMSFKEGSSSTFVGKSFEFMKIKKHGDNGHIAIETLSVERALEWFAGFGVKPIEETIKKKGKHISTAYLDREILGFALHLNRR